MHEIIYKCMKKYEMRNITLYICSNSIRVYVYFYLYSGDA